MTPLDIEVTKLNFPGRVMSNEHIDSKKKFKKRSRVSVKIPEKFNYASRFTQNFAKF